MQRPTLLVPPLRSRLDTKKPEFLENRAAMLEKLSKIDELLDEAAAGGGPAAFERLAKRGKLPVRERVGLVLDPDSPFLELSGLAAYGSNYTIGGGSLLGIGVIAGVECVIFANDASVLGGALTRHVGKKWVRALEIAESLGRPAHAVDLAADFRHPIPTFETLYAQCHPAPTRAADFHCGLPDLDPSPTTPHAAHPGCFATAVTLACAPLLAAGWVEPVVRASAVTGSTGSGGTPKPGTHHPTRHGNLWGYKPLAHRHAPEMSHLLASLGGEPVQVHFAPHSGPFARGIAATCFLALTRTASPEELSQVAADFYAHSPFVEVVDAPPRLDAVIGTNRCQLHLASNGTEVVVQSVIDNLVKGASGGAIHWLNRLFGLPQTAGLDAAPLPWS